MCDEDLAAVQGAPSDNPKLDPHGAAVALKFNRCHPPPLR